MEWGGAGWGEGVASWEGRGERTSPGRVRGNAPLCCRQELSSRMRGRPPRKEIRKIKDLPSGLLSSPSHLLVPNPTDHLQLEGKNLVVVLGCWEVAATHLLA